MPKLFTAVFALPHMMEFNLTPFNITPQTKERLDALYNALADSSKNLLGYPSNLLYEYSDLWRFFAFSINNVGDPFKESLYDINTRVIEREVVSFFAKLYHAPQDDYWGYVTNGGTESNMYGMYLARESLPDGTVYFSEDTHYGNVKAASVLRIPSITIKSEKRGEMDYADLEEKIKTGNGSPPIIMANIGTTMKGAIDRIEKITDILHRNAVQKFSIHCDAALGGMILPFADGAPMFDFRLPVDSISVSGHKMIGSPIPCGIVIARKKNVERIQRHIEFLNVHDTTLSGSRDGHSVLFLWYAIQRFGYEGFQKMVAACLEVTRYALDRLKEISWDAYAEEFFIIIVIRRPSDGLAKKWQLAVAGDIAHLVIMPHVSKKHIDAFIEDLVREKQAAPA